MTDNVYEFTVESDGAGKRVDGFLSGKIQDISRTRIKKSFAESLVTCDGVIVPPKRILRGGENIRLRLILPEEDLPSPINIPLRVLFEDEHIVCIDKPPGIVVHAGNGTTSPLLVEGVLAHCRLSQLGGSLRPGVVHRLDKDTSGVVIFAKTDLAYLQLIKMFASRAVRKAYRAIVCGTFVKNFGKIDLPIGRNRHVRTKMAIRTDGKGAVTEWNVLETLANRFTHLQLHILTGRTHQIRVHMAYLGHPIVGDVTYGYGSNYDSMKISPRVMLHASKISLSHPLTGEELTVSAPLPQDFLEVLGILSAGTPPSQNRRR